VLAAGLCDDGGVNGKNCQSNGGFLKARYIRVEKGGQVITYKSCVGFCGTSEGFACVGFCGTSEGFCGVVAGVPTVVCDVPTNPLDDGCRWLCARVLQRGFIGRYPLHFHKMGDCPECEFLGNAVVNSQQRGIVIHSTHRSTVMRNVVFGVKGAFIYVEEGVEIGNTIQVRAFACCL
jgi:hypothetical protein